MVEVLRMRGDVFGRGEGKEVSGIEFGCEEEVELSVNKWQMTQEAGGEFLFLFRPSH
jgi:hypothetical protein